MLGNSFIYYRPFKGLVHACPHNFTVSYVIAVVFRLDLHASIFNKIIFFDTLIIGLLGS